MKILVKFPTRGRPDKFLSVLQGWVDKCDDLSRVHWLISVDADDTTMDRPWNLPSMCDMVVGSSSCKIDAINRDINELDVEWDAALVLSDDMVCVRKGWDTAIEQGFDSDDQLLWFFDGKQRDICTLPLMTHKYYDRTKYIYHPSYLSVFADDEQTAVARRDGCLKYIEEPIAIHRHPANFSDVKKDALYQRNETDAIWRKDQKNYKNRKARNFPE